LLGKELIRALRSVFTGTGGRHHSPSDSLETPASPLLVSIIVFHAEA
jgi:hypothetical protein